MIIPYEALGFPASAPKDLHGSGSLSLTWPDLVWAAITVGKPGIAYVYMHSWHSISDLFARSHTVYANLCEVNNHIAQSSLYKASDPTEKGATSFFMGMAAAKLACSRFLGTPYLFHFSMSRVLGIPIRSQSKLQPDLLGQLPNGDWVIVEAKGRTGKFDATALDKAKRQTQSVLTINGSSSITRVAAQTYFEPWMKLVLKDPEPAEETSAHVEIDLQAAYRRYYSLAYEATQISGDIRQIGTQEYIFSALAETNTGIAIGIRSDVRARLASGLDISRDLVQGDAATGSPMKFDNTSIFPDGLAVSLDKRWSTELMKREPIDRADV